MEIADAEIGQAFVRCQVGQPVDHERGKNPAGAVSDQALEQTLLAPEQALRRLPGAAGAGADVVEGGARIALFEEDGGRCGHESPAPRFQAWPHDPADPLIGRLRPVTAMDARAATGEDSVPLKTWIAVRGALLGAFIEGAIGTAAIEIFFTKREQFHSFLMNAHASLLEPAARPRTEP